MYKINAEYGFKKQSKFSYLRGEQPRIMGRGARLNNQTQKDLYTFSNLRFPF